MKVLNIVYSSDNGYARHAGVSMTSLFEHNRSFERIDIYMLDHGIQPDSRARLEALCREYGRQIRFVDTAQLAGKLRLENGGGQAAVSMYGRLFLAGLLPASVDKALYFDCDSIVHAPLDELWDEELGDAYAAGVLDTVGVETKRKVNLRPDQAYVNSGMLLVNVKKWREDRIEDRFTAFIDAFGGQVFHHDQGVINGVLSHGIRVLHPKYNAMTTFFTMSRNHLMDYYGMADYYGEQELAEAARHPVFVHYTPAFAGRPWVKGNKHPMREAYRHYLALSPWRGITEDADRRGRGERAVAYLYNTLPFPVANAVKRALLG